MVPQEVPKGSPRGSPKGARLASTTQVKIHHKLDLVNHVMEFAATKIQADFRMHRARLRLKALRKEKRMREMRAQREHDARMTRHAVCGAVEG